LPCADHAGNEEPDRKHLAGVDEMVTNAQPCAALLQWEPHGDRDGAHRRESDPCQQMRGGCAQAFNALIACLVCHPKSIAPL
jgi:hypothetical protein